MDRTLESERDSTRSGVGGRSARATTPLQEGIGRLCQALPHQTGEAASSHGRRVCLTGLNNRPRSPANFSNDEAVVLLRKEKGGSFRNSASQVGVQREVSGRIRVRVVD